MSRVFVFLRLFAEGAESVSEVADVFGVDEAALNGFGDAGARFVDDVELAGEVFLAFLDVFVAFVELDGDLGCCAAGGFEEEELALGVGDGDVEAAAGGLADVEFGGLFEGEHDGVVEVALFAAFEAFDGAEDVIDRESAGGVFADEGLGTVLERLEDDAGDFEHSLAAVAFVREGVVEAAGEDGDADARVFAVDAVGDEDAARGFALELHVDEQVVGHFVGRGAVEGGHELTGAVVRSCDLRAGAAMVIAGLCAKGETIVEEIHFIERGYENFVGKLKTLGADIAIVDFPEDDDEAERIISVS
mgnify:CR=1 FL=1